MLHCGHRTRRQGSTRRWWVATTALAVKSLLPATRCNRVFWMAYRMVFTGHFPIGMRHLLKTATFNVDFFEHSFNMLGKTQNPFAGESSHLPFSKLQVQKMIEHITYIYIYYAYISWKSCQKSDEKRLEESAWALDGESFIATSREDALWYMIRTWMTQYLKKRNIGMTDLCICIYIYILCI